MTINLVLDTSTLVTSVVSVVAYVIYTVRKDSKTRQKLKTLTSIATKTKEGQDLHLTETKEYQSVVKAHLHTYDQAVIKLSDLGNSMVSGQREHTLMFGYIKEILNEMKIVVSNNTQAMNDLKSKTQG